jgi:Protein of unknown function (DUF3037)
LPPDTPFAYCVLRVVPDIERAEFLNVGVVLFARQAGFLEARIHLDAERLRALSPECDPEPVARHLAALELVAVGDPGGGPIAALEPSERFNWMAAPSSTVVQASPVHTGVTDDPARRLDGLFARLVGA